MVIDRLAHAEHYALTAGDKMRQHQAYRCHRTGRPVSRIKCIAAFGLPASPATGAATAPKGNILPRSERRPDMGISITCPHGHGETDRGRCFDRAVCLLPPLPCLLCPIPFTLVAQGGRDNLNRQVAARLPGLISSPWTPPPAVMREVRASRAPRTIGRGLALSQAVTSYLEKNPEAEKIPLTHLLRIYNNVPLAIDLPDVAALASICRRQCLPLLFRMGRAYLVVSDHLRAFIRSHKVAA